MHIKHDIILRSAFILCLAGCGDDDATGDYGTGSPNYPDAGKPIIDAAMDMPMPDPPKPDAQAPVVTGPKAYIGLFGDSVVAVLDLDNKRVIKTVPVTAPDGLVITPDGKKVYVSSMDTGSVKVIETTGDTMSGSIDVGSKPAGLIMSPDGKTLVVAVGGTNEAVLVDTASDAVTRHAPVGQAHAGCISSDNHYAYVGSQLPGAPAIVRVDLASDAQPIVMPVDKSPRALACESDVVYFTSVGLDAVEVLDRDSGALKPQIATGGSPHDIRPWNSATELVVSQTAGDLEFIDTATQAVTDKIATGALAHWITFSQDRKLAYVTNEKDDNVSVVDLAQRSVRAQIPVGKAPRKMALKF
jgi:YVTN family beta-propeller protein